MTTAPMTYATCRTAAIQTLRGVAHMLAERHGDDLEGVRLLNDAADDIVRGEKDRIENLMDLAAMPIKDGQDPDWRNAVKDAASTACILLNGCDW